MGTSGETIIADYQVNLEFEAIPAEHGDCLLILAKVSRHGEYLDFRPSSRGEFRILIDTGPGKASLSALRARLTRLTPGVNQRRFIDLAVFTHLDADHIGNAAELLRDETLRLDFGDIWFNGYREVEAAASANPTVRELLTKGFRQADELSEVIEVRGLPHNKAFQGDPAMLRSGERWRAVRPVGAEPGSGPDAGPLITLLSPTSGGVSRLLPAWDKHRDRLRRGEPDEFEDDLVVEGGRALEATMLHKAASDLPNIEELARAESPQDHSIPNGSSLAFVVEHRGVALLLLGDAHPAVYEPAFAAWRDQERPDCVPSMIKLSHHGSRRSTTKQTAGFGASNYFVSTSGARFAHPDDETLALLVQHARAGTTPKFWFNYASATARRWERLAESDARFDVQLPTTDDGGSGMSIWRKIDP